MNHLVTDYKLICYKKIEITYNEASPKSFFNIMHFSVLILKCVITCVNLQKSRNITTELQI